MAFQEGFEATYFIDVDDGTVKTLVTNDPSAVDRWTAEVTRVHRLRLHRLVVGLDVEWHPNIYAGAGRRRNPVATLQLCVGRRCLVLQLLHARLLPASLRRFLSGAGFTFVGVGIGDDLEKLDQDHGLSVGKGVDLAALAAERRRDGRLRSAGLKTLAMEILGVEMEKPKEVTLSAWDNVSLSYDQIRYACFDAFVSFELGRVLEAWKHDH